MAGNNIGAPMDHGAPFGAIYQGTDLADERGTVAPDEPEVTYDGPGVDPASEQTPYPDATEQQVEHADENGRLAPDLLAAFARLDLLGPDGAWLRTPREVWPVGGDLWQPLRLTIPATAVDRAALRRDRKRLRVRVRVVTADSTVYIGPSQQLASTSLGYPLSTGDDPLVLDGTGELWIGTDAVAVEVALLVETRNMPATL